MVSMMRSAIVAEKIRGRDIEVALLPMPAHAWYSDPASKRLVDSSFIFEDWLISNVFKLDGNFLVRFP